MKFSFRPAATLFSGPKRAPALQGGETAPVAHHWMEALNQRKQQRKAKRTLHAAILVGLAAIALPTVAAIAAPDEWYPGHENSDEVAALQPMGFETPGESFPGSAFYYLDTQASDPLPLSGAVQDSGAATGAASLAGPAARPFHLSGTALDSARAQQCLAMAIYYEAASESDSGQRAVAQVVLNRVAHPAYPSTVCGVVFQGSERQTGCQFSFTCDGSMARKPARLWWDRAEKIATQALAGSVYSPVGLATHYHTVQVHPYWADSLDPAAAIGMHQFYRWRGVAGLQASFTEIYHGHEPMPGSKAKASSAPAADPVELAREFVTENIGSAAGNQALPSSSSAMAPAVSRQSLSPAYSEAVRQRGGDALYVGDLPAESQIKPQYANSGQWIAKP